MGSLNTRSIPTPQKRYEEYMSKLPAKPEVVMDAKMRQIRCEICKDYLPMSVIEGVEVSEGCKMLENFQTLHLKCAQGQQSEERKRYEHNLKHNKRPLIIGNVGKDDVLEQMAKSLPGSIQWIDEAAEIPHKVIDETIERIRKNQYTTNRLEKILNKRVDTTDATD